MHSVSSVSFEFFKADEISPAGVVATGGTAEAELGGPEEESPQRLSVAGSEVVL